MSVWEVLVWWLSDLVSDSLLFHRSAEPQVLFTTGTWCECGRFLSDDWVIGSLICFYSTLAKSHKYRFPQEHGFGMGGSCLIIEWFSLWYSTIPQEWRTTSIVYHVVSVREVLVWWLSDWVSDILLFHRSEEPQVSVTTGTWCLCGRLLWRSWRGAAAYLWTLDPIRKTALSYLAPGRLG